MAVGIDVAEPMVAQAAQRLRALGRGPAAVAVMDAEQLGLRPASFDVVCMASAVYLLAEPTAVLRGLRKLLRPGGRLAVSDFGSLDERWAWKHELVARYADAPPVEQLGGDLHGPADLEHLLRWTDATSVTIQVERLDVVHADPAAWWAEQWTHGERWALERMDDQALAAYQVAAFAAIEACREADGAIHWRPEVIYAVAST